MQYQEINSRADVHNDIALYRNTEYNVPHWHTAAELLWVEEGAVQLYVDGKAVLVPQGMCALVMPNQLHAFRVAPSATFWVHVFSGNQTPAFFSRIGTQVPQSPLFCCKEDTRRFYYEACLKHSGPVRTSQVQPAFVEWQQPAVHLSPMKMKAVLYAVLADFSEQVAWTARANGGEQELFGRILQYVQQHYAENITLASVAAAFGYEPHYFCRRMKRVTGMNFRRLINLCRVEHAQHLLETENCAVTTVAAQCGFECLRTFNRVFYELCGCTPSEYRRVGGVSASN